MNQNVGITRIVGFPRFISIVVHRSRKCTYSQHGGLGFMLSSVIVIPSHVYTQVVNSLLA